MLFSFVGKTLFANSSNNVVMGGHKVGKLTNIGRLVDQPGKTKGVCLISPGTARHVIPIDVYH